MERFTIDKPVSEMNMAELALNCCYVKDHKVRYRDYRTDIDARELARNLLVEYGVADKDEEIMSDEDAFDMAMIYALSFGPESEEGLIALFYRCLWVIAELREKLKEYEERDEQGRLMELPYAIGDTVYMIEKRCPNPWRKEYCDEAKRILEEKRILSKDACAVCPHRHAYIEPHTYTLSYLGCEDKIYGTREAAKAELEEMEGAK